MPKPSFSRSGSKSASSKYNCTVFEPGANELFTHGFLVKPFSLAFRASKPAAIMLRGLLVLVQLVMAAIIIAPSGIPFLSESSDCFSWSRIPALLSSCVATRRCGLDGPAIFRPTVDRSNVSLRSYSACFMCSAHNPVCLA